MNANVRKRDYWGWIKGYLHISPSIIGFGVFVAYPLIMSVYYALTEWNGYNKPKFVGFDNFHYLFTVDPVFLESDPHHVLLRAHQCAGFPRPRAAAGHAAQPQAAGDQVFPHGVLLADGAADDRHADLMEIHLSSAVRPGEPRAEPVRRESLELAGQRAAGADVRHYRRAVAGRGRHDHFPQRAAIRAAGSL